MKKHQGAADASGVTVSLAGETATTDNSGSFTFEEVPKGSHVIQASASGYQDVLEPIFVEAGGETTVELTLLELDNLPPLVASLSASPPQTTPGR